MQIARLARQPRPSIRRRHVARTHGHVHETRLVPVVPPVRIGADRRPTVRIDDEADKVL
eukprot:CAMPEP_0201875872 /NCGR_PEP_ID=MMETSP0902-20130614/7727_1 /ASSEMBLY_ACC=CAM_ASM_000551 /TAXON_ID=420261 /ORGANISM="Thalassiosira antarctica, Strain CCMP982" /LENGTH=58 /DNA_ID=CAMNT_0048403013 /DNA_START=63 /DNA_END=235 /DNA_ORIENTATION=+